MRPDMYEQIMRVNSLLVQWVGVVFIFLVGCRLVAKHEVIEFNPIQYCEKHSRLLLSFMNGFRRSSQGRYDIIDVTA